MPIFIRALSALNAAREWFSFAGEAVSFLGLAKRAVAVGSGAAVLAGGLAVVAPPSPTKVIDRAIVVHAPEIMPDIREQVLEVSGENLYSKLFLVEPKNAPLLQAILSVCKDERALPYQQCDIAEQAREHVVADERENARREARARAVKESKIGTVRMPWEHGDLVK